MTLGTKLGNLRREKHFSQLDIAQKLDISQSAYNKWESDKSKPSIDNLLKISNFYEKDIYDLLGDVSNVNIVNKKCNISNIGNPVNSTFYTHSPELTASLIKNQEQINKQQEQIAQLMDFQNKLMEKLLAK